MYLGTNRLNNLSWNLYNAKLDTDEEGKNIFVERKQIKEAQNQGVEQKTSQKRKSRTKKAYFTQETALLSHFALFMFADEKRRLLRRKKKKMQNYIDFAPLKGEIF